MSRFSLLYACFTLAALSCAYADPERVPVGVTGDENAVVTGELGQPLLVLCLAYKWPQPMVKWYRGLDRTEVLDHNAIYDPRGNVLLISSLSIDTLGIYACQGHNGEDEDGLWMVTVRAYRPESNFLENDFLVPRHEVTLSTWTLAPIRWEEPIPKLTETTSTVIKTETTEITGSSGTSEETTSSETSTSEVSTEYTGAPCTASKYGCCFDNETAAIGPDNQGCPCNASEFGCCPDGVSPGCECQKALHGCCPDNITIAQGPDNQGCGCQYTQHTRTLPRHTEATGSNYEGCGCNTYQFGCCPDGTTIAEGPEQQGCHCRDSKFGCCGDGETPASGPDAAGCNCFSSRYGCCPDGQTEATGAKFHGCTDAPVNRKDQCNLPIEAGSCAGNFSRWGFNVEAHRCEQFTWGGCEGNANKFSTEAACQLRCDPPRALKPQCTEPQDAEKEALWSFSQSENRCVSYYNSGCGGNHNRFQSLETCEQTCLTSYETKSTVMKTETTEITGSSGTSEETTSSETSTSEVSTEYTGAPCAASKYGCCFDNETAAIGPDNQGCPCNASEFGCCPDGVSPAQGAHQKGCPRPCTLSPFGCCQDDKTPAHGPDFEGCCLLQAFGCCPDNRKPAEGPHLEGCECQKALHGCCPDNITIAQGPDNQGCGCQYTQHGCCPDRHTEATGSNYEGCGCNTYQFSCCPDGTTIAEGPEQQGCHCRGSKFGCCDDGETPASGPDAAGCDCSSSRYGCCPDGHTEATGAKFHGCTDAPVNRQADCSLSTDAGSCKNYTPIWFYDLTFGGCSSFWYGGCEGNGNRFATKEECEDICVQPPPKDACKLPVARGPCDADLIHWHYNSTREQCIPFRYGGCLGNANNFDTRELCQAQCEPYTSEAEQCNLPIEVGSCAGNYSRWGFNVEANRCEQFIWGGCEGNANKFSTETACQWRCDPPGAFKPQCTEPQDAGNCTEKEAVWSFSQSENRCVPFYYSGCGGNDNRFQSLETCEETCPSAYVPDKCTLPFEIGDCSNYREKWFYDTTFKRCRQFYYGGCGGNENNFATLAECENSCTEIVLTTTTIRPTQPQSQTQQPTEGPVQELKRPEKPAKCTDNPFFANCDLIVRSKYCRHKYYGPFCCKSCAEAEQLDPQEVERHAEQASHTNNAQINVQQLVVPAKCTDNPFFANCDLIVRSKFCRYKYYSTFCCKSCAEAGQLDPQEVERHAEQAYIRSRH